MQTVLVVDDEEEIRFALERILIKQGLNVILSESVDSALEIIPTTKDLSLVISDVMMDGKNGIDLVRYVFDSNQNLPVILITGNPNLASAEAAVRYKAFDYISKPFHKAQILEQIKRALEYKLQRDLEQERLMKSTLMEEVLRSQNLDLNRQNAAILNATSDSIITVDKRGTIVSANLSALENFCIESPMDMIGNHLEMIFSEKKKFFYKKEMQKLLKSTSNYHSIQLSEVALLKFDGTEFFADIAVCAYKIDGDMYFTGIIRDVTQKKEMVNRLIDSERRAFLSTLAASIGHEINNSLTAIQGYLEMALKENSTLDIKEKALKVSMNQAQKLQSLTNNLLHLGKSDRMKSGKKETIELNASVETVLEVFRSTAKLKHCQIRWNPSPEKIFVKMNSDPFTILFSNILINAGDATSNRGEIDIVVTTKEEKPILLVRDNGQGMSQETLKQIFEPYFTTKELGKGTGLGMFVVKQILDSYHIQLKIDSNLGKGSSFEFIFPKHDVIN